MSTLRNSSPALFLWGILSVSFPGLSHDTRDTPVDYLLGISLPPRPWAALEFFGSVVSSPLGSTTTLRLLSKLPFQSSLKPTTMLNYLSSYNIKGTPNRKLFGAKFSPSLTLAIPGWAAEELESPWDSLPPHPKRSAHKPILKTITFPHNLPSTVLPQSWNSCTLGSLPLQSSVGFPLLSNKLTKQKASNRTLVLSSGCLPHPIPTPAVGKPMPLSVLSPVPCWTHICVFTHVPLWTPLSGPLALHRSSYYLLHHVSRENLNPWSLKNGEALAGLVCVSSPQQRETVAVWEQLKGSQPEQEGFRTACLSDLDG